MADYSLGDYDQLIEFVVRDIGTGATLSDPAFLSVQVVSTADRVMASISEPWSLVAFGERNSGGGSSSTVLLLGRFNQGFN